MFRKTRNFLFQQYKKIQLFSSQKGSDKKIQILLEYKFVKQNLFLQSYEGTKLRIAQTQNMQNNNISQATNLQDQPQKEDTLEQQQKENDQKQQSDDDDDRHYNDNNWNFSLPASKPFDLKAHWLGNTEDVLKKFQQKFTEVQIQKGSLKKGLQQFKQNQANYHKSSMRKIHFNFDKKKIYQEFMQKSRKPIQKLHVGLLLNIGSYVQSNIFFFLAIMRRVSKIFNFIYKSEEVVNYLSQKDLGERQSLKKMQKICQEWLLFQRTFMYYKQIKYTDQIPPNSFKTDLERAVTFINDIHKMILKTGNFDLGYFRWVNTFMKTHRVVIALSTLSLTNLIMIRKPSIVAFSNYLAFNPTERRKQEITKTKYSQVLKIVQDQDYKDCLIINTKVSNYLQDEHQFDFSVFILHSLTGKTQSTQHFLDQLYTYNVLIFHKYNDQKSKFLKDVKLTNGNVIDTDEGVCLRFDQKQLQNCEVSFRTDNDFNNFQLKGILMKCLIRDYEKCMKFSQCIVYNEQYHYVIVIKNLLQYQPNLAQYDNDYK